MWTFTVKRIVHLIPILLGVSLFTFLLMTLTPGDFLTTLQANPQISPDKVNELRMRYGLDQPWYVQYLYWLKNAAFGDLGYSFAYKTSATELILGRLWNTFLLSFSATLIAWSVAIPLGVWAAVKRNSLIDRLCGLIAFVGLSIPEVLLALLALMFAYATGWFPVGGAQSAMYDLMTPAEQFGNRLHHLVLPTLVLAASELAGIMRQMRSNLLDTLRADFVTSARAKGLAEGWVVYKHALRNAINPLLTIFGYSSPGFLAAPSLSKTSWLGLGWGASRWKRSSPKTPTWLSPRS